MSVFHMDVTVGGRMGHLRLEIAYLQPKQSWQCDPPDIVGAHMGDVRWQGGKIGLFANGDGTAERPYAILDVPENGLDEAPVGETGEIRIASSGVGQWVLRDKIVRP